MGLRKIVFGIMLGLFCLFANVGFSQDQKLADSLTKLYTSGAHDISEFDLLKKISEAETNNEKKIAFAELLIKKAYKDSLFDYLHSGFLQKGNALLLIGNNVQALQSFLKSLEFAQRIKDDKGIGAVMISIADTYSIMGNSDNAELYYTKGIGMLKKTKDSIPLASALLNAGDEYFNTKKYDKALVYFEESGLIFKKLNYAIGNAYNLGNVGMVYAEQGKDTLAEKNISEAIAILEELEDYYPISVYLTYMADIYAKKGDYTNAFRYAQRSLNLATKHNLKNQISDGNLKLSQLYEQLGNHKEAYKYYKDHIVYRDSVKNIEAVERMANLRTDFEVSQKQTEVDLLEKDSEIIQLKQRRQRSIMYISIAVLILIVILAYGLLKRYNFIKATKQIIEDEKSRSDTLLLNILPEETAEELKQNGKVQAKKFESVTVLFTDFKEFTRHSESLTPEELVESVDYYFSKFDDIMESYGLEKIKTVGDAYMCAGGLPFATKDHAYKMILAAFDIIDFVNASKSMDINHKSRFEIRIGINTGPVVAGVVGTKKFAYDIWGDTVNVASRMESNSEAGKVNISQNTYELVKDLFDCEYRGKIDVKNRGMMKMYFVNKKQIAISKELHTMKADAS